ncbi:FliO/MopB family protein [Pararhodospirillum photometricum]|uniref:Flagellar protein n=1 Tax=Pararhodospirillum photometricum DSM 122 TaxID=1150469 RepID=H6SJ49_PARPM|nr:flagellar biosynthetic protein FliO [Pararhodospirillum photometricum]CCG08014.1 Putative uncharacterized protein [Pararhodospirillum photometricum DSM 122]
MASPSFAVDPSTYVTFVLALVFVIGLIFLMAYGLRRWAGAMGPLRRGGRRLALVEALPLDPRHRLVLVRRDDVEHLVVIGASSIVVVETGIPAPIPPPPLPTPPSFARALAVFRPAPSPPPPPGQSP